METAQELPLKRVYGDILKLAWPCLTELILVQIVSMVDLAMVGALGATAISAVGLAGQPILILSMIFSALNIGTTAVVSRACGEGNIYKANVALQHALVISAVSGVIMSVLGFLLARPLVLMLGAEDAALISQAVAYTRYRMIGLFALAMQSAITAALRGMGNSRTAMLYNLTANAVNVLFNYLLIHGNWGFPAMGVRGAALATSICQIVGFLIAFAVILKGKSDLRVRLREKFTLNKEILGNMVRIGLPSMFEQTIFRIGILLYTSIALSLGEVQYAAHQICLNIQSLTYVTGQAVSMTTASLTGQSLGRGDPARAERYNKYAFWLLFGLLVVLGGLYIAFGKYAIGLFIDDADVIAAGIPVLMLFGLYLPLTAFQHNYTGALQGAGDTRPIAVIMLFTVLMLRPTLSIISRDVLGWGLLGLHLATAIDQLIRSGFIYWRYKTGRWKTIRLK